MDKTSVCMAAATVIAGINTKSPGQTGLSADW
jgi:hypothetical protein